MKVREEFKILLTVGITMIMGAFIGINLGEYKANSFYQYELKDLARCVTPLHKHHGDIVTDVNWVTSFSVKGIENCQEYVGRGLLYLTK